ncbi:hypothetical protein Q3G72_005785 [Acer saccharum]|nr:hypothetical protein Q3G72_005785 [Acer saccharum]
MKKVEPLCEYCGVLSAVVYCKPDIARLCLNCDEYVHSANFLSSRHNRYLLCDKCNSQPAIFRCMDDKISLCQDCDWENNGCLGLGHNYQILDSYTGCPSSDEFSRIWSSVLDPPCCNDRAEESNQPKTSSLGQKECVAFQSSCGG